MNKISAVASCSLLILACASCGNALAAPIAPKVPVTKSGKIMNYDRPGPCPSAAAVGAPGYPGSVCMKSAAYNKSTAFVDLMSGDSAAKVADWYGGHLKGWTRTKALTGAIVFTPPGERTNDAIAAFTKIHISIETLDAGTIKIKKMIYAFKWTPETEIDIEYALGGSSK